MNQTWPPQPHYHVTIMFLMGHITALWSLSETCINLLLTMAKVKHHHMLSWQWPVARSVAKMVCVSVMFYFQGSKLETKRFTLNFLSNVRVIGHSTCNIQYNTIYCLLAVLPVQLCCTSVITLSDFYDLFSRAIRSLQEVTSQEGTATLTVWGKLSA